MKYPDALILDWFNFVGGEFVKPYFTPRNGRPMLGKTIRAAVAADITSARMSDAECIRAFLRSKKRRRWAKQLTRPPG